VLLRTATLTALASTVTVAPARNPVPVIITDVGRTVDPVDGEIAVTLGAPAAPGPGGGSVGPDGDRPSQAADPIANISRNPPRLVYLLMASFSYSGSGKAP
jgi:hypothetical protein